MENMSNENMNDMNMSDKDMNNNDISNSNASNKDMNNKGINGKDTNKYEIDMCNGPLFSKLILFSFPLIASGILQLLFNAADVIVVGRFAGKEALGAVGSTSSLTNLIVNIFIGLSIGTNVMVARFYGSKNEKDVSEAVHTSILISIIAGFILAFIGYILARPMLTLMGTPDDIVNHSVVYMRIYFLGMPVMMLYNFGSAILRAVGDTRRPLIYLSISGVVNVILNLIFVIKFGMGVSGVAYATVISQGIAAILVVICLMKADSCIRLDLKKLRLNKIILGQIAGIGFPAGIQGAVFSISNVIIQSTVNSFGSTVVAGNTAAQSIEGFVYTSMNAIHQAAVSFIGQNSGAKKMDRVKKSAIECFLLVTAVGVVLGNLAILFGPQLLSFYSDSPEVIEYGMIRLKYICFLYCLCGIMDVFVGCLRGLGKAVITTLISLFGACALRIIYIYTLFPSIRSLGNLYLSYPVSWFITAIAQMIYFVIAYKEFSKKLKG